MKLIAPEFTENTEMAQSNGFLLCEKNIGGAFGERALPCGFLGRAVSPKPPPKMFMSSDSCFLHSNTNSVISVPSVAKSLRRLFL